MLHWGWFRARKGRKFICRIVCLLFLRALKFLTEIKNSKRCLLNVYSKWSNPLKIINIFCEIDLSNPTTTLQFSSLSWTFFFKSTLRYTFFLNHITLLNSTQKITFSVAILMVTGDDGKISFLFIFIRSFGHHNEKWAFTQYYTSCHKTKIFFSS